jgi:short-subunit dehydrogenase
MNIIILGGGTPNKFGHDFVLKAREEGHKVICFSHKFNGLNDKDQYVIDYNDVYGTKSLFKEIISSVNTIDLLFINANGHSYPSFEPNHLLNPDPMQYQKSMNVYTIIPHMLIAECYEKMPAKSKVVYMTTLLALTFILRPEFPKAYGYAANKSFMTQLMLGFAQNRTKDINFSILSPHFPYDDLSKYKKVFDHCYNSIMNDNENVNGKILAAWDTDNPPYELELILKRKDNNNV